MRNILFAVIIFFVSITASTVRSYRHNTSPKNSHLKSSKSPRVRSDVFENLFIIYDPSFLSIVWPKITNGVHVNIDLSCFDDLSVFYRALTEGNAWAYSTVDATGRYQPGFFQGSRLWLGSKELCFRLDNEYRSRSKHNKENALKRLEKDFNDNIQDWPPFNKRGTPTQNETTVENTPLHRLEYVAVQILLNITKFRVPKSYDISLGLCLPRSCSPDDVLSLINFSVMLNDNLKSNGSTSRTVKVTSLRQIEEHYDIRYDSGAVLIALVTLLLTALAIVATILDVGLIKCLKNQSGSLSVNVQNNATIKFGDEKYNRDMVKVFVDLKKERIANKDTIVSNKEAPKKLNVETMRQVRLNEITPTITLDVIAAERQITSCKRCGKYRKQCVPKMPNNMPVCTPKEYKNCATVTNTEYRKRDNVYLNLLLSFSLKHNWKRIFNTKMANKDLAVVHLLRIFATFWVIFIHVAILVDYLAGDNNINYGSNSKYRVLTTGTLAFDTLFFASGMFSAHHFFYLSSRYTVRQLVSCGGCGGKILQFVCFVTNRAIRLLPPYIYTVFATAALSRVWRDTAATAFPEKEYDNCDAYWWRNLLYITLFYPREQQCMQISWYLSTETTLHVCSALVCVALTLRRRPALLALNALLLGAVAMDVLKAFSDYHRRFTSVFEAYESLIERPLARAAPYLMGVMAGWLVHVVDGRTRVSRVTSVCLWAVSLCALVTSLAASSLFAHWGCAWLHLCWPAALLWPAIACSTDQAAGTRDLLESAALAALSRLSYCSLLVHGLAARWLLLAQESAICEDFACLWSYTAGSILLTEFGALLMALLIEMPCCCLLRRITDVLTS